MECEYFRSFRYFEPDIQPGAIIAHADGGPGPDFRVRVDDDVIEVEVTRLCTPLASFAVEFRIKRVARLNT